MILIGTSGWSYKHWMNRFYPTGLAPREQLTYLSRHFPTVELNASFYRLPPESNFAKWRDDTPDGFKFSVKVPRVITHLKRLAGVGDDWRAMLVAVTPLADKVAVFLCQFPPSFRATDETVGRLRDFLTVSRGVRIALEFRHATWFADEVLAELARQQACVVHADSSRYPHTPDEYAAADFRYYRLHGPRQLYASQYTDQELEYWAGLIRADVVDGRDSFAYFDNDFQGYAIEDAKRLTQKAQG
jgi:uncharacterized protein YecE (DUF72 family)